METQLAVCYACPLPAVYAPAVYHRHKFNIKTRFSTDHPPPPPPHRYHYRVVDTRVRGFQPCDIEGDLWSMCNISGMDDLAPCLVCS